MKVVITMSGGKDSEASAIWAKEKYGAENCVTVFCDVGWEAPETYEFIDYLVGKLGMEHFTLKSSKYDGMIDLAIKKQRFPSTTARFCTQELKVKPIIDWILKQEFKEHYLYLTVKHLYVTQEMNLNRPGIHSDGFMTDDINYIWSNEQPTVFYSGEFPNVPMDDELSINYFEERKQYCERVVYPNNTILRLDQFNIHETNTIEQFSGLRCFVKVSFSKDRYDLKGNARNGYITSGWNYRERKQTRNIPQTVL